MNSDSHRIVYLPLELWREITSHLSSRDIKSLRLACKQFCNAVELRLERVFLSANPLNIEVFRAVADHELFRQKITEIIWDDARLSRGPRRFSQIPGWEHEAISDAGLSDNETENSIRRRAGKVCFYWDFNVSDEDENGEDSEESDDDDEDSADLREIHRSAKFRTQDCPLWFKAECAASIQDIFWRQAKDGMVDTESLGYKSMKDLASAGLELGECWKLYQNLIGQQDTVLAGNDEEEAFRYGITRFPAVKKVTVTPAAHRVLYNPLYQIPMMRLFPPGFNYPIPRGWPMPHELPEEVFAFPWRSLDEKQKEKIPWVPHRDTRTRSTRPG